MEHWENLSLENIIYLDEEGKNCIEQWFDVPKYKGYYQISNLDRVKGIERFKNHPIKGISKVPSKILKQGMRNGYRYVSFCKGGISKHLMVHRLIAIIFIPNPDNKPCVNHKNGIKTDTSRANLEWCTYKENAMHAHKTGLTVPVIMRGEKSGRSKITEVQAKEIIRLLPTTRMNVLAKKFGLSRSNIYGIRFNRLWSHLPRPEHDIFKKGAYKGRRINVYDKSGNLLSSHHTVREGAKHYGLLETSVSNRLHGRTPDKNLIWKYVQ